MRLGVVVTPTLPWARTRAVWTELDALGVDVGYVYDHLTHRTLPGRWLADGWATLAAVAAVTERLDLGTLVASLAFRRPVSLARLAATVDEVSGGRLVLGIGAGAPADGGADTGTVPEFGTLSRRLHETVEALDRIWAGQSAWQGRELAFSSLETLPLPDGSGPPYLMVAAHGPRGLDLVARRADAWSTYGGPAAVESSVTDYWREVGEQSQRLTDACLRHGRDPGTVRRSLLLGYGTVRPLVSVEAYLEAVGRAGELGYDEVVVYSSDGEPGTQFHSDPEVLAEGLARARA